MSTPIIIPAPRPPLERAREGRVLGGVSGGVASHLGLPVKVVRVGFVAGTIAGGVGAALYCWLWALMPAAPVRPIEPVPVIPVVTSGAPGQTSAAVSTIPEPQLAAQDAAYKAAARSRIRADLLAGVFLVMAGAVLIGARNHWDVKPGIVLPILIVAAGAVIAYAQIDDADRARWFERTGMSTPAAIMRLAVGVLLVVLGVLLLVVQNSDVYLLGRTLLAAIAVLGGVAVVLAPWGVRMWRDLDLERAARARESERADIAAHLHDSVLQTLALIQHRSHDGSEVSRLARAQERDLRSWLYGAQANDPTTMAARVAEMAAEVEDMHAAVIEVVTVGDRTVDDQTQALLAALREAVVNAVRHAGSPVRVYVESSPDGVEAFVRDRGPGFVLAGVPEDRHGVKESIIGRMERHGGEARVRSTPGEGTEVRLWLPDEEEES